MRLGRPELRVENFEYVEVGPELALLRLAGAWRGGAPSGVRLIAAGEELAALPEPPSEAEGGGLWRAAWSASGSVLAGPFVLEADDGRTVELEPPRDAALPVVEVAPAEPEPEPSLLASLAAAERALEVERARHDRAEASLRAQLETMVGETAEFMGRLEGYELRRAELEKELSWERLLHKETRRHHDAAELERDEAVARLAPVEEELARIRREVEASARAQRQLADARERVAELERRIEGQEELLNNAREVVEGGGDRLAELEERLLRLRDAATGVASQNGHAAPLVTSPEQVEAVERAIEQADRGSERLAQLERRVGELREGIATQPNPEQDPGEGGRRRFPR
jgi:DNA repair exonuclease SbcCD ATPase subunit